MRKSIVVLAALALAGCATASNPNGLFKAQYFPPTAGNLKSACDVASPDLADQNACMLYKTQVWNCQLNLNAVNGVIAGAAMAVPGYGPAVAAGIGVATPLVSAAQLQACQANGFIVPAAAPVAATK